jgi:hypothetical protein
MLYNLTPFSNPKINGVSVHPTSKVYTSAFLLLSRRLKVGCWRVFQWHKAYTKLSNNRSVASNFQKGKHTYKHTYKHIHTDHGHLITLHLTFSGRKGGKVNKIAMCTAGRCMSNGGIAAFSLWLRHLIEVSGQFTARPLYPRESVTVPTAKEAGWTAKSVRTQWRRNKSLTNAGKWTRNPWLYSP